MSKLKQTKIPVVLDEDNLLKIAIEQGLLENEFNWKLIRERDGLTKQSKEIMWLEWNEEGRIKSKHDTIGIGYSLIMSPFNDFFTWQTTTVTEILEQKEDYIKFKTNNSVYELYKNLKNSN
jgi:YD repeat-containing protein